MIRFYPYRNLLFRFLSFFLVLLLLVLPILMPHAQAFAVAAPVVAYGAKELVAVLLIAGGAVFASTDSARDAASQVWDWLGQNAANVSKKIEDIIIA